MGGKMKHFIRMFLIVFTLVFSLITPVQASGNKEINELNKVYSDLLVNKEKTVLSSAKVNEESEKLKSELKTALKEQNVDKKFYAFFNELNGLNYLQYMSNESGAIIINEDSNMPVLLDISTEKLIITIGTEVYTIEREIKGFENNLILRADNGKKMYLHKESYDKINNTSVNDEMFSIMAAGTWKAETGPAYGNTSTWTYVTGIINSALGIYGIFHPIVGAISVIAGIGLLVGAYIHVTLYTKSYFSLMSDCLTYTKQRTLYYKVSNYTEYIKTITTYYHTVNPYDAGGACPNY